MRTDRRSVRPVVPLAVAGAAADDATGAAPFAARREGMIDILADALETHVDVDALLSLAKETR